MPEPEMQPDSASQQVPPHIPISDWHRRLARYLYLDDLIRSFRLMEIGCGEGRAAAFLAQRGATQVVGIDPDAEAIERGQRTYKHGNLVLRHVDRQRLSTPGGLGEQVFDLILLAGDGALLRSDGFLAELRRVLAPGGHVVVAVVSKEAFPTRPGAMSYFELTDRLEQARSLGPVAMLGQSPFLAATVVPFGVEEPELVMDDSLAVPEPPEEYIALCGPQSKVRPFQVIQLPTLALGLALGISPVAAVAPAAVPASVQPDLGPELARLRGEIGTISAERDALAERVQALHAQGEAVRKEAEQAVAAQAELQRRVAAAEAQLVNKTAQVEELGERLQHRTQSSVEQQEASLLHERHMRELRDKLDERDAFIAELEEQSRSLVAVQGRVAAAEGRAEKAEALERQSRQRLAEIDGLLLRTRAELAAVIQERDRLLHEQAHKIPAESGYVDPAGPEGLAQARAALDAERATLQAERTALDQDRATLQAERATPIPRTSTTEDQAAHEAQRREVEHTQQRLRQEQRALDEAQQALAGERQALLRGSEEIAQLRAALDAERQQTAHDRAELLRMREDLQREAQELAGERQQLLAEQEAVGVPVQVGDLPTAPHVSLTMPLPSSPQEEAARLQARVVELEAECAKLKDKASDAERDSWKYMKARSDAEAAAAEVREDAARKLRDARKLASVELTRAMEEATKKAVALREELTRTESERKEAVGQLKELRSARDAALRQIESLRQETEALRWSSALPVPTVPPGGETLHREVARVREEGAVAVLAVRAEAERAIAEERSSRQAAEEAERRTGARFEELRGNLLALELALGEARDAGESERQRVETLQEELRRLADEGAGRQREAEAELMRMQQDLQARERTLSDLRVEREALGRLLAEVEREAYSRAERARELRTRMLERDREVEALRVELLDRDRKIIALEQQTPPAEEITRLEAEMQGMRARLGELDAERGREDASRDEAVATALRERARAARLTESLVQAARERDEALGRIAELEQRLPPVTEERNRLRGELDRLEEVARRAHGEVQILADRLKQTKRELEAEEKRAAREGERAQEAVELARQLDESRRELSDLRVRMLELQAELAKCRAELARHGAAGSSPGDAGGPGDSGAAGPADVPLPGQVVIEESSTAETSPSAVTLPADAVPTGGDPSDTAETVVRSEGAEKPPEQRPEQRVDQQKTASRPPMLEHHMVRRVLALGHALGLEPLHVPIHGEPDPEPVDPQGAQPGQPAQSGVSESSD